MIWIGKEKVDKLFIGGKAVGVLYLGAKIIWKAISLLWHDHDVWRDADEW